jgi:hypothetical protein
LLQKISAQIHVGIGDRACQSTIDASTTAAVSMLLANDGY